MANIYHKEKDLRNKNKKIYTIPNIIKCESGNAYEIYEYGRLGNGGHAAVYKCINKITGEEFAIKFQLNFGDKSIKRFLNSINVLKHLNHANLLKYIDSGYVISSNNAKKIYFLIMDLYENGDLETSLCKEKIFYKPEVYVAQFINLASALATFHKFSIHRDIKPANILIGQHNWVLADYGLCTFLQGDRITADTEKVGPILWLTPEAVNKMINISDEISKSSDVYQLAAIFWFIVNHKHPTGVLTKSDWRGPRWLFQPIYKALSHNKNKRYKDGQAFLSALKRAQKSQKYL